MISSDDYRLEPKFFVLCCCWLDFRFVSFGLKEQKKSDLFAAVLTEHVFRHIRCNYKRIKKNPVADLVRYKRNKIFYSCIFFPVDVGGSHTGWFNGLCIMHWVIDYDRWGMLTFWTEWTERWPFVRSDLHSCDLALIVGCVFLSVHGVRDYRGFAVPVEGLATDCTLRMT